MGIGRRFLAAITVSALVCAAAAVGTAGGSPDTCRAGTKRAVIGGKVRCLTAGQRCSARYESAYKRYGFTCVNGRLRKRAPAPAPPPPPEPPPAPPPPPPPPAQPGHYHGTDSQLEVIDFDVRSDGRAVTNLTTGQINQGCTPPGHIYGGGLKDASAAISADGSFLIDFDYQGTFSDGTAYNGHFNLSGHFSGSSASGTLSATLNFAAGGTGYRCGSGQQTWTANRTG
jgi:hypothetical protein